MYGEVHHPITGVTQSVKGRGSNAGNLVYREMLDEEGRVIGVRIDSNDDSGFWLEIPYPNTSQPKETDVKNDEDEKEEENEEKEHNKKRNRDDDNPQSKEEREDEGEGEDEEDVCEMTEYERLRNGNIDARACTEEPGWKLDI